MYDETTPVASPVTEKSPTDDQQQSNIDKANGNTNNSSDFPIVAAKIDAKKKLSSSSVDDILEQYYEKLVTHNSSSKENNNSKKSHQNDPHLFTQLGAVVQKRAVQNRDAVRKGVINFSKSTAYLTSQLSKGPLSDHDMKWLEVGLMPNQPSPIRDSLFKIEEVLIECGKALDGIEGASERYLIAKKRREMLVERRDKLLRIAAKKQQQQQVSNDSIGSAGTRGRSPEQ